MEQVRWLRVPFYNLPLVREVPLDCGRLVPLKSHKEAQDLIRKHKYRYEFVVTAALIVAIDEERSRGPDPPQEFWSEIGPLIEALQFLYQRHVGGYEWSVHATPTCEDEAKRWGRCAHLRSVLDGEEIRAQVPRADLIRDAVALFRNVEVSERTRFRYALNAQLMAQAVEVAAEMKYVQQWLAFEIIVQRWADTDPAAPKDVHLRDAVVRRTRDAVHETLSGLRDTGLLSEVEVQAIIGRIQSNIYCGIGERARAFLPYHGISGVDNEWLDMCIHLRNDLVHGRTHDEISERRGIEDVVGELLWRGRDIRRLVNRYVMRLMGYKAQYPFEPQHSDCFLRFAE